MPHELKPQQLMISQRDKKIDEPEKSVEQERKERIENFLKSQKEREERERQKQLELEKQKLENASIQAIERSQRKERLKHLEDSLKTYPAESWPKEIQKRIHLCYSGNPEQTICGKPVESASKELAPICEECFKNLIEHKAKIVEMLWKIKP